ncbi:unnamed protein product, partial [Hymenolepis diminuta]
YSPPNLSSLDEQIIGNIKWQLPVSQGEKIVEEVYNPLHFRHQTMSHTGVQILVHLWKKSRSLYAALTFKLKTDSAEIYLNTCYHPLPKNPETPCCCFINLTK